MTEQDGITLWEETIETLKKHGKDWENVYWVCIGNKRMHKSDFEKHAKDIKYYPLRHGGNMIRDDLRLYGLDFVMYRDFYDGAEWWKLMPTQAPSIYTMANDKNDLLTPYYQE